MTEVQSNDGTSIQIDGDWILTGLGMVLSFLTGLTVYFLKSRCKEINCCFGALKCIRDPIPSADLGTIEVQPRVRSTP